MRKRKAFYKIYIKPVSKAAKKKKTNKKKLWGSYFNTCRWVYSLSFSTSTRNGYSSFTVKNAGFFVRVLTELLTYYHQREGHHLLQFPSPYPCLQPSLITVTEKSIIINKQTNIALDKRLCYVRDFPTQVSSKWAFLIWKFYFTRTQSQIYVRVTN